ncbi:hypothetical protein EBT31_06530 [bacterium]|nr:hypothetical protein [bacterium]NBX49149.1 hypothetical protein [bacterium]
MRLRACVLGLCLLFSSLTGVLPRPAEAITAAYAALRVTTTGGGTVAMAPGERRQVTLTFQNTGASTWKNDGPGYISVYTYEPKYRKSSFDPGNWLSPTQVRRLNEASVAPGGTGTVSFELHAPQTPGTYKETFALAAEDIAWIPGGQFTFNLLVGGAKEASGEAPADTLTYEGSMVTQTANALKVKAGRPISFMVALKNTGTATWNTISLHDASGNQQASFAHSSWNGKTVAALAQQAIAPGQTANVQFFMQTPQVNGVHKLVFSFKANEQEITGAEVNLPIEVTGGTGEWVNPSNESEEEEDVQENLLEEPMMRVGVLIVDEETDWEVRIGSHASEVEVRDTAGKHLLTIPKGSDIRAAYSGDTYVYGSGATQKTSTLPLRFVPVTANAVLEVTNFDRRVTRGTSYANNTFRNVLELRYNATKDRTWLINELPMEYYLRGLGETSNFSPEEFQKALMTAARTYAYFHYTNPSKHAAEGYHVDAYRDQVYWGYGQEERNPLIAAGVEATRGQIVTYEGQTAITSYFSRSDGRTRNWSEVWGREVPYAKSVAVPCDQGKSLWGHGVGMSASGAICMAKEGKTWEEILKYFYTGVEISRTWK